MGQLGSKMRELLVQMLKSMRKVQGCRVHTPQLEHFSQHVQDVCP